MNKFYIFLFILFVIGAIMLYYRKPDEHMTEELQPIIPIDNTPKKKYNTVINYM
jgi:hypothetical protein